MLLSRSEPLGFNEADLLDLPTEVLRLGFPFLDLEGEETPTRFALFDVEEDFPFLNLEEGAGGAFLFEEGGCWLRLEVLRPERVVGMVMKASAHAAHRTRGTRLEYCEGV
jgi:hypothetical protein